MKLPEPQNVTYSTLLSDIEIGQIKIPQFQREFVWSLTQACNLMDSVLKGYPIGTFIFWRTNDRLRAIRDIGNLKLPDPKEGEFVNYVLDGQQRMTSLFASLKGLQITRESGKIDNFSEMYIDLSVEIDEQIVILDISQKDPHTIIKVNDLLYGGFKVLAKYNESYHENLDQYKNTIQSYTFSIILLKEAPIDIATEVFTRINVGGKKLTLFEIMIAKTYDYSKEFDLATKYRELILELTPINYEILSDATVLQTISLILVKGCKAQQILKLDKHKFIDVWNKAIEAIKGAVEYFKYTYRIPVSQLLPYNALIVPFSYFFYHHKDIPTGNMQKYLQDFFWRSSISGRYSSSVESKLAQDVKKIDEILVNQLPKYEWSIDVSPEFIKSHGWFSASRSYIKAILCIYAYHQPKSFNTNALVNISNYWLKQANSRNYHHFFPKAFLSKKLTWDNRDFYINHILNITIVDDFLNKREIAAKAPSKYMKEFLKKNDELENTMKSHLISNLEKFGIWDDNYQAFFDEKAKAVSKELRKRVIQAEIDSLEPANLIEYEDAFEETLSKD
jgi:hypothetical protein